MASKTKALGRDLKQTGDDGMRFLGRLDDVQHSARDAAPELARHARDALYSGMDQVRDHGRGVASAAGDQLESARVFVVDHVQERPLTTALAALGLGLLVGLAVAGAK